MMIVLHAATNHRLGSTELSMEIVNISTLTVILLDHFFYPSHTVVSLYIQYTSLSYFDSYRSDELA